MIDPRIIEHAISQGGYIRRSQLFDLGLSPSAISRRIADDLLTPVGGGIYRVVASDRHENLLRGALLSLPDGVVSFQSAAYLLEFPKRPKLIPTVTVHTRTTHTFPGVLVRRCSDLHASHIVTVSGLRTTNVARTVFDLSGILGFDEIDTIVEELVLAGKLKVKHLAYLIDELARKGKRGTGNSRRIVESRGYESTYDPTVLERLGLQVLEDSGVPTPRIQHPVPWSPGKRFDAAYPEATLAIEWDSRRWHRQQAAIESDRARDRTALLHGWVVVRFTWTDVTQRPTEVSSAVSSLLSMRVTG